MSFQQDKLEKLKSSDFSWTYQRTEATGQHATLKCGVRGIQIVTAKKSLPGAEAAGVISVGTLKWKF